MHTVDLLIKAPPFSVNKAHYRSGVRTQACRKWGDSVMYQLMRYKEEFKKFSKVFNPLEHLVNVELTFYLPKNILLTKKGNISRRSQDLSNVEKMLIDLVFDPRFVGRTVNGMEYLNLDCDDTAICQLLSRKRVCASQDYEIAIRIQVHPISSLF